MSQLITLSFKDQEKKVKTPKDYSELKKLFLSSFEEDEKSSYTFKYKDESDDENYIDEDDDQFEEKISEIIKIQAVIFVEKGEDLEELNDNNENNKDNNNNENNNGMRSAMIFTKINEENEEYDVKELNQRIKEIEKKNVELEKKISETEDRNIDLIEEKKELQKQIDNLKKKNFGNSDSEIEKLKKKYEQEISLIKSKFSEKEKKCQDLETQIKLKQQEDKKNMEIKEKEIINKSNKIKQLEQELQENNKNMEQKSKKIIEEYTTKIKNYEEEIKLYKSEIEKSKLDIINLKNKEKEAKEKNKFIEELLEKKYKEKADEEIDKIKIELNNRIEDQNKKLKLEYEKKFQEKDKKIGEELNQISEMMASLSKVGQSTCNFVHEGIKCQKCLSEPITGIRYKCLECKDYNLCQKCEEENSNQSFHNIEHSFIKMYKTKEKEKIYSYDCLNILNLSEYIYEGTQEANIIIILQNNGNEKWPNGKTKLIFDESSQVIGEDIILHPQNTGEKNKYSCNIKNLGELKEGEYKASLLFNVEGKNYGENLTLIIKVKKKTVENEEINKNIDKINEFRENFSLSKEEYSDEKLLGALKEKDFNFEESFSLLFN